MQKFCIANPKVGPLSSRSCDCSDALWAPRPQVSKVHTHPSMASFAAFFSCSILLIFLCSLIQTLTLTPPPNNALLANMNILIRCPLAANFASAVGPCVGIVKPFKLLRVTAHPQFLALELQVPMGTCPGQYGTTV